jgi:hypothetical protein
MSLVKKGGDVQRKWFGKNFVETLQGNYNRVFREPEQDPWEPKQDSHGSENLPLNACSD